MNVSVAVPPDPSFTVRVITVDPNLLAAGVTVTVRSPVEPPKTMLAFGASVVLEDEPETVRFPACVSRSPTVNGISFRGVSSEVV